MLAKIKLARLSLIITPVIILSSTFNQTLAADVYKVTSDVANVRYSNSTSSKIVSKLYSGETISISEIKGKWAKIDKNKYISTSCIKPSTSKYEVTSRTSLEFKTSPSNSSKLVKDNNNKSIKIKRNTLVDVINIKGKWAKIKYKGKTGYVNSKYLSKATTFYEVTAKNGINIRKEASSNSDILGKINYGAIINVEHTTKNWAIITYEGEKTYVSTKYIKKVKLDTPKNSFSGEYYISNPSGKTINIRSGPNKKSTKIGTLKNDTKVKVLSVDKNNWAKIEYNGKTAYCYFYNLSLVKSTTSIKEKKSTMIKVAKDQLGKKYLFGSEGLDTFDCSSFVRYIYQFGAGIELPRTSKLQSKEGVTVKGRLQIGDLIFFDSVDAPGKEGINHVGMYIGFGRYIHAPRPNDVIRIDRVNDDYYTKNFVVAKRFL